MQPQLDHIVILVPYSYLASPPSWITENFTITPGGAHADGLTEKVLILLPDGVYLELIAFTESASPSKRAAHRWGRLSYGISDYALTLPAEPSEPSNDVDALFTDLQSRWKQAGVGGDYYPKDLVAGARKRSDGQMIKWRVANPAREKTGIANFWCIDTTPRRLRVPLNPESTEHPSGVKGLKEVLVKAGGEDVRQLDRLFGAYLPSKGGGAYALGTPVNVGLEGTSAVRVQEVEGDGHEIVLVLRTGGEGARTVKGEIEDVRVELRFE